MDALIQIVTSFIKDNPYAIAILFLISELVGVSAYKENSVVQVLLNIIKNILASLGQALTPKTPPPPK